ncbi:MAG: hypothetical protein QG632_323 [Candidatus Dependentiae bacterium]|nr:hypothetical protein [Candidatus Dependentiae bacterium]
MLHLRGLIIACVLFVGSTFASLHADFVEKTISVVVQQLLLSDSSGSGAVAASSTKTITVGELSIFSLHRTSFLLGKTPDVVFAAPYYYAATVILSNSDGTPFQLDANGEPLAVIAYLGIAYENGAWKDVSGISVDSNGVRQWPAGVYASFSNGSGSARYLQGLLTGITANTVAYGTTTFGPTAEGESNVPQLYTLSDLDVDVLTNPSLFFTPAGTMSGSIMEIATNGYKNLVPEPGPPAIWGKNTLPSVSVSADSPSFSSTVQVEIGTQRGGYVSYNVPKSMVYQVMNPFPFTTPAGKMSTVSQYYLNTLSDNQIAIGAERVSQPFQCFVPVMLNMQLYDYYLKVPNEVSGGPALLVALAGNGPGKFLALPPSGWTANLTDDSSQILIQGLPFFKDGLEGATASISHQLYCCPGLTIICAPSEPSVSLAAYLGLVGSASPAALARKKELYLKMKSEYVTQFGVAAATEEFFAGQVAFRMRPLDQINTITQAQIQENPLSLVSFWENAMYGNNGTKMSAVLQDGAQTAGVQKQWSNPGNLGGMLQVQFTTVNPSISYDGVMIFPSSFVGSIAPYYRTDLWSLGPQFWFAPSAGVVTQLSLTFDATTITGATIATDAQVKKLAVGTTNPLKGFAEKANSFWGLMAPLAQAKKHGMSELQKTQIGLGVGLGVAGAFGAYQWYKRRKENKD